MKNVVEYILCVWRKYNPFDIESRIKCITDSIQHLSNSVDNLHLTISRDIAELEYENAQKELILQQIIDCLPDMVWFKDVDGKYVYANQAIKRGLLMCANPIGKTDVELSTEAKAVYGNDNHTFGEKCANSDLITIERNAPSRFLESGKVKGDMLYLEVYKNVVRNSDGEVIGVCGTGRDLTEYMTVVKQIEGHCAKRCGESDIVTVFKKYEFGEEM